MRKYRPKPKTVPHAYLILDLMEPGNIINGLAILEHPATTLLVPANRRARMDERKFVWLENI